MAIEAYSLQNNGNRKLSTNFNVREFRCRDGSDPIFVDTELVKLLQQIRNHFGKAVVINSAYRTPNHNRAAGGTTFSQHLYGKAADIRITGVSVDTLADYADRLLGDTGGVGRYYDKGFVHVDVRTEKARWKG